MSKAIFLFDLDDTLLDNDIQSFLGSYLKALSGHVHQVKAELLIRELMVGTAHMLANQNPAKTLEEAFDEHFYPAIGISKPSLRATLDDFYTRVFAELHHLTNPRPQAVALVQRARSEGFSIGIATNPLFPRKAILHRLNWAGLSAEQISYLIIPDYSTFHFAKPNPAFFAELLGQLGYPQEPVVMIGNSLEDDILPAAEIGLPSFWLTGEDAPLPDHSPAPIGRGGFYEIMNWWAGIDHQHNHPSPQGWLHYLRSTPAVMDTLLRKIPYEHAAAHPPTNEWGLAEILAHLRDVEREVNLPRIKQILAEDNPFLPGIDSDSWAGQRAYQTQDAHASLLSFLEARCELLDLLADLTADQWQRPAKHAIFGPTRLSEMVAFIHTHDQAHVRQSVQATGHS